MRVELSPEQSSLIELGIREGRFQDPQEAIGQALAPWVKREQARLELLSEIAAGEQSPREEDVVLDSDEQILAFFAAVEQRGRPKLVNGIHKGV